MILVDDLTRPTPVATVMPMVLEQFEAAGISPSRITILMATGTHNAPASDAMLKKVGAEAAGRCRLLHHRHNGDVTRLGRTTAGSPVYVNSEVPRSDFVMGISGIYPQHKTGFGGGPKLALGVLGTRSIVNLHHRHPGMDGSHRFDNPFRQDVGEMARMLGLHTMISLLIDANREIIRVVAGDHFSYFAEAANYALATFATPMPDDADVVISNAYPSDVSLTFSYFKALVPLEKCPPNASRILISSNWEGVGRHGLTPLANPPRFQRERMIWRRLAVKSPGQLMGLVGRKLQALVRRNGGSSEHRAATPITKRPGPIWIYRPRPGPAGHPSENNGMRIAASWDELLQSVCREQGGRDRPKVAVYPCAPLQCLIDADGGRS